MTGELPPLPDELKALFDAAGEVAPPPGLEAAVLERIGTTLAGAAGAAAGAAATGTSATGAAATGVAATGAVVLTKTTLGLGAALLLAAGAVGGVAFERTVLSSPPAVEQRVASVEAPKAPPVEAAPVEAMAVEPSPAPGVEPEPSPAVKPPPAVKASPPVRAPAPATAATRDTLLSRERSLLEVARTAMARGDVEGTLSAVEAHAKDFPQGRLAEEREVLFIQALTMAGRRAEALRHAESFRRDFPDSLLAPAVDAALGP